MDKAEKQDLISRIQSSIESLNKVIESATAAKVALENDIRRFTGQKKIDEIVDK